ncbi:SH3 domain-containing protein [Massilia timonae]|uniref:Bacterial SH3 domain protein n=1 Tax=Massilia timonae TaxID=47229 RepID=A0A1S2N776_9BURK|nr:SH3 domain-containing protein [Massilia timonae]OIJ40660.1 bacterial SH3 domain protein [Massilia timonae]
MVILTQAAAYALALALTLCLCAWLTPRAWWRRPNARALGVLGVGTAAGGTLLLAMFGTPALAPQPVQSAQAREAAGIDVPVAGARYRVHDALNLRVAGGIGAERLLVVPAGARVEATGRREGDWWQVRATVDGEAVEGWASSLWLRRADEGRVTGS